MTGLTKKRKEVVARKLCIGSRRFRRVRGRKKSRKKAQGSIFAGRRVVKKAKLKKGGRESIRLKAAGETDRQVDAGEGTQLVSLGVRVREDRECGPGKICKEGSSEIKGDKTRKEGT